MIFQSKEPHHENLNEVLQYLSNEESFKELSSNPEFSFKPFLQAVIVELILF